jgi:hypothetical protein
VTLGKPTPKVKLHSNATRDASLYLHAESIWVRVINISELRPYFGINWLDPNDNSGFHSPRHKPTPPYSFDQCLREGYSTSTHRQTTTRSHRIAFTISGSVYLHLLTSTDTLQRSRSDMRLIKQNIERDGSGTITLFPEEPEDMVSALPLFPRF